jgi:hypothetical protein
MTHQHQWTATMGGGFVCPCGVSRRPKQGDNETKVSGE